LHLLFLPRKEALYPERNKNWRMSDETLETYIQQQIAQSGNRVIFRLAGRGTDPDGAGFFRRAVVLRKVCQRQNG
jgi:uncharacterized protein